MTPACYLDVSKEVMPRSWRALEWKMDVSVMDIFHGGFMNFHEAWNARKVATRLQDFESQITAQLSNLQTDFDKKLSHVNRGWDGTVEAWDLEKKSRCHDLSWQSNPQIFIHTIQTAFKNTSDSQVYKFSQIYMFIQTSSWTPILPRMIACMPPWGSWFFPFQELQPRKALMGPLGLRAWTRWLKTWTNWSTLGFNLIQQHWSFRYVASLQNTQYIMMSYNKMKFQDVWGCFRCPFFSMVIDS